MSDFFLQRFKRLIRPAVLFIILLLAYYFLGPILDPYIYLKLQGQTIYFTHIVLTCIWILIAFITNIFIDIFIWEGLIHQKMGTAVPALLKTCAEIVIFIIAIIMIVGSVYQKSVTGLIATTGIVGIVLGFALKGILENAFQGIALNIAQIFKTGDVISIPGKVDELAIVEDITLRNTYLRDFMGRQLAIPNTVMSLNVVKNYSLSRLQLFSVTLNLTVGSRGLTVADMTRIINAVLITTDFVSMDPPPQIYITEVQNIQLKYEVTCWIKQALAIPSSARHILYTKIIEELAAASFTVGSPNIDYDEIEKRYATTLHQTEAFLKLNTQEREHFYQQALTNRIPFKVLSKVNLFASFTQPEITSLSQHIHEKHFKAQELIINQGDQGYSMYILVEGAASVTMKDEKNQSLKLATLMPGDYFGEMSLLIGEPRSATISALTDCIIYEISKKTLSQLFRLHPEMMRKISHHVSEKHLANRIKQQEFSEHEMSEQANEYHLSFIQKIKDFFSHP